MRNLAIALVVGLAIFAALFLSHLLKGVESSVPAVLAAVVTYVVLARRTFRQLEGVFTQAAGYLQNYPPKFEQAVREIEKAYPLAKQQIGIRSQVDTQIGVIYFLQKEFNRALPYLKRSTMFGHWMGGAMLGVIYYKKKEHLLMRQTFETVTRRGKKNGLAWCLYAYLLVQIGDADEAQKVLTRGTKSAADDTRVNDALLALQNGKKIKMRAFKEQWYQFHLERPPQEYAQQPVGGKMSKAARRGKW